MDMNYEESVKRLEEIVSKLEEGSLSLEDSLKLYEEGAILSDKCRKMLNDAKLKITNINEVAENG